MPANETSQSERVSVGNYFASVKAGRFEYLLLFAYAIVVSALASIHTLFRDEMQAWVIVRDAGSLGQVFTQLHYEGHPALWYLLLYWPARHGSSPTLMVVLNTLCAIGFAALLLHFRIPRIYKLLLILSMYFLFDYSVIARTYSLAALLLMGAAACWLRAKPRTFCAVVLLVLAIQTHIFAIPVAAVIAFFGFFVWHNAKLRNVLSSPRNWFYAALLCASVVVAYFTVRLAPDAATPQYGVEHHSVIYNFLLAEGKFWQMVIPVPGNLIPGRIINLLMPRFQIAPIGSLLSAVLLCVLLLTLKTKQARWFYAAAALLELVAYAITVHAPPLRHYGLIFVAYAIALMLDGSETTTDEVKIARPLLNRRVLTVALLLPQALLGIAAVVQSVYTPFSEAKPASDWLKAQHLDQNPMVVEPDIYGSLLLGYLNRPAAYYPSCQCYGTYTVWNRSRDDKRLATNDELNSVAATSSKPLLLITSEEQPATRLAQQHLRPLQFFNQRSIERENYFIYVLESK
jgi:hypothetical protein